MQREKRLLSGQPLSLRPAHGHVAQHLFHVVDIGSGGHPTRCLIETWSASLYRARPGPTAMDGAADASPPWRSRLATRAASPTPWAQVLPPFSCGVLRPKLPIRDPQLHPWRSTGACAECLPWCHTHTLRPPVCPRPTTAGPGGAGGAFPVPPTIPPGAPLTNTAPESGCRAPLRFPFAPLSPANERCATQSVVEGQIPAKTWRQGAWRLTRGPQPSTEPNSPGR